MTIQWTPARRRHGRLNALVCGLALLVCKTGTARSQASQTEIAAAQAMGTAFLKAVQAADWKAAAGFLDIVPLDHYRLSRIDAARRRHRVLPITVEQLMKVDSQMPRAVAEYQVQQMKEHSQDFNFLELEFGIADPDSLAAMPASVVAQHWLEVHDRRWDMRTAYKRSRCPMSLLDSLPPPQFRILGTIVNGDIAYLLYERDDDPPPVLDEVRSVAPNILFLRRGLDSWWVLPRQNVSVNMTYAISIECPSALKRK